jgi:hypothetical protein
VHLALGLSIALSWAAQADLPRSLAQEPGQDPLKTEPLPSQGTSNAIVDLEWLDLTPGVGLASYSSKFRADPALAFSLRAHAPMPWLSPSSDAKGEYFGLFAEAAFSMIDRELSPIVSDRSGLCTFLSVGVDFSFLRDPTWILVGRAGVVYAHYGGVADLNSGLGPLVGATLGVQLSGKLAVTLSPELVLGDSGSHVLLTTLGVLIQF